jgi:hypothetical protein
MAQQTINVGTSPNDGTGTPLRTAFQYTNSNFSELYTAVGPSGNNIVVPGTATITGDLTVDTSTLKVDSANNRVGIGTATPDNQLSVRAASIATIDVRGGVGGAGALQISGNGTTLGTTSFDLIQNSSGALVYQRDALPLFFYVNGSERYAISSSGVATWSNVGGVAGTAMTLNSTGLGVGATPDHKLQAVGGYVASGKLASASSGNIGGLLMYCSTDNGGRRSWGLKAESGLTGVLGFWVSSANNTEPFSGSQVMSIDASGNVGVGVTPSGSGGCLQLKSGITFPATQVASSDANTLDDYEEGTWTPTITAETGTIGSTAVISADYTKVGRLVSVTFDIRVITVGTGTAGLKVSLPFSPSLGGQTCGAGREYINTGKMCQVSKFDATNVMIYFYDNTTVISANSRIMAGYTYFV